MKSTKINKVIIIILNFIFLIIKNNILKLDPFCRIYSKKKFNKGVALCTVGKLENNYIKEYVNHYKLLGVKKIFLYDNNEINGEKFEDVIQNEVNSGFIKIINIRGKFIVQGSSYEDCILRSRYKYDFLLFFDMDEFLHIQGNYTINSFLSHPRYTNCQVIKINWLCYGDNENIYYKNETLKKRFTKKSNDESCNTQTKSIIKIKDNRKISWGNDGSHMPLINVKRSCDSLGNPVYYGSWKINPPQYEYVYLKHYLTKSSEEYSKRFIRGDATYIIYNKTKYYETVLDVYFGINNFSFEKISVFEKRINVDLKKYIKKFYFKLKD